MLHINSFTICRTTVCGFSRYSEWMHTDGGVIIHQWIDEKHYFQLLEKFIVKRNCKIDQDEHCTTFTISYQYHD